MKNLMPVSTKYGTVWVNLDWIVTIHDGLYGGVIVLRSEDEEENKLICDISAQDLVNLFYDTQTSDIEANPQLK